MPRAKDLRLRPRRPAALRVQPVDELRRRADLLEDLLFESRAFRFEAFCFAEDDAGAILLAAFEEGHAEVHEVRCGRAEVRRLRQEIDGVREIAAFEVDPAECGERELLQLFWRIAER